jgi:hypothetical protein
LAAVRDGWKTTERDRRKSYRRERQSELREKRKREETTFESLRDKCVLLSIKEREGEREREREREGESTKTILLFSSLLSLLRSAFERHIFRRPE